MKVKVNKSTEVEVKTLRLDISIYYEDISNDFPLIVKDGYSCHWWVDIDIETGTIKNWPQGRTGTLSAKISDAGAYYLLDENNNIVAFIKRDYVPNKIIPPKDGYGNYIRLYIDENGKITNWYEKPDISEFKVIKKN